MSPEEIAAIPLDGAATAKAYLAGWHKVSWSKLQAFQGCRVGWFFENFAVPVQREAYQGDESAAIPGTITQRVWEAVINDRVFLRFATFEELTGWCRAQTHAIFRAIVFPYERQFEREHGQWRAYFRSNEGKRHLAKATEEHGLDPVFHRGMQPKFIKLDEFWAKHKGFDRFCDKLSEQYEPMLLKFAEHKVDLRRMLSEVYIRTRMGNYEITGSVDFLYNVHPMEGPFDGIDKLQPDYLILDGKAWISPFVKEGQLYFYAMILHAAYRKIPSAIGFINWSKSDFVWHPVDLNIIEDMKRQVLVMQLQAQTLAERLERIGDNRPEGWTMSVYDIPGLEFTPNQRSCRFCGMVQSCRHAKASGYDKFGSISKAERLAQAFDMSSVVRDGADVTF